jgi:putative ABC transport system permease protein
MDRFAQDLRYSLRRIGANPGFSAIVIITLALGIGANTAIFSMVDAVLFRSLPYEAPERLLTIRHRYPSIDLDASVSAAGFRDYRDRTRSFAGVAVQSGLAANLTGIGDPERITATRASAQYFSTLGITPALGRAFSDEEDATGRNSVVVLSDGFWKRRLGGRADVVGSTIQLNGETHDVIGVMPPGFRDFFNVNAELWVPLALTGEQFAAGRTNEWLTLTARLAPGVTMEGAAAEMTAFAELLKAEDPNSYPDDWSLLVTSLNEIARGDVRAPLFILLGAVGFVLLIACANVANLMLARAASRRKEVAVRTALGARRWQVTAQLLTESTVLALAGGLLGLLLAFWGVRGLVALVPTGVRGAAEAGLDSRVLGFTVLLSFATGVLFGIVPALQVSGTDVQDTLREGGRGAHADRRGHGVRRALVVAEIALALTLLIGAGLLLRSFARLQRVDPGFDARDLLTAHISLPQVRYPSDTARIAFIDQLLLRIAAIPGVRAAGGSQALPFSGSWSTGSFSIEGLQVADNESSPWGDIRIVTPDYHQALSIPLRRGRTFTPQDGQGASSVAIVDDEMVRRYWPDTNPIGKRITFDDPAVEEVDWIEVVGVVGHAAHEGLDADPRVQLYLPNRQIGAGSLFLAMRTEGAPEQYASALRQAVLATDPDQPIALVRSMDELMSDAVGQRRLSMVLIGGFAALALLLAALGIYGVMSYLVNQRTQEIGVRLALGARATSVVGLVMRQGIVLTAAGVPLGIAGAVGLTRVIESQLFGVRATDPLTFAVVAGALVIVALLATYLPAQRAARLDPVRALRQQ